MAGNQVPSGLSTTFALLASTPNQAAVPVLIAALASPDRAVQHAALRAIMERQHLLALREVLRRLHTGDEGWREALAVWPGRAGGVIREALLDPDPQLAANACQACLWMQAFDMIPVLAAALDSPAAAHAAATLLELAEKLHEGLHAPEDFRRQRLLEQARHHAIGPLEDSARRYGRHRRAEAVEALLLVADRNDPALREMLYESADAAHSVCLDLLARSQRPGTLRLLLSFLEDPRPPLAVLQILAQRGDRPFVETLLCKACHELSATAHGNLERLEQPAWQRTAAEWLPTLDIELQLAAVRLAACSARKNAALALLTAAARRGAAVTRQAAIEALQPYAGEEVDALIYQATLDPDPRVQAAACRQLRPRNIPQARERLVALADSPAPEVRAAVREQLSEYTAAAMLAAWEDLDEANRTATARLVFKLDPQTTHVLRTELRSPARKRRLRALEAAHALDLSAQLEDELLDLLADEDPHVRAAAAQMLGASSSLAAQAALREAQRDSHPAVRQAVAAALNAWQAQAIALPGSAAPPPLRVKP